MNSQIAVMNGAERSFGGGHGSGTYRFADSTADRKQRTPRKQGKIALGLGVPRFLCVASAPR
jgi:hypothetical protein